MRSLVLFKPGKDSEAGTTAVTELAPIWRKVTALNPVVTLIGGFRSLFGAADSNASVSLTLILALLALGLMAAWLIVRAGYRLKS